MVAAADTWLVWCATAGVHPLSGDVGDLERAARQLRGSGATERDVLDLVDQVGFMTGMWRTAAWVQLRRTI